MAIRRTYDNVYRQYGEPVPVAYLRALAYMESRQNPRSHTSWTTGSGARGLFQVTEENVTDYNKTHSDGFDWEDMFNPIDNTKVFAWSADRIMEAYRQSGIPAMQPNWTSFDWVKLFTAGWNSGAYSKAGVLKVAQYLHDNGIPVTHENVFKYGKQAGATKNLQVEERKDKRDWQSRVAFLYWYMKNYPLSVTEFPVPSGAGAHEAERAAEQAAQSKTRAKAGSGWGWLLVLLLLGELSKR